MTTKRRDIGLDILRILLCAGVTIYHFTPVRPSSGSFMVLGFFVLSGYLLGRRFFSINELDVCEFFRGKLIRLVPMFIMALLVGAGVTEISSYISSHTFFLLPSGYDFSHFNPATFVGRYNPPCWYIVNLLALMVAAPLFFFFSRYKYGLTVAIALVLLLSVMVHSQLPHWHKGPYYLPLVRSWQFMVGILAAQLELQYFSKKQVPKTWKNTFLVLFSAAFLLSGGVLCVVKAASQLDKWNFSLPFNVASVILFACLIPLLFNSGLHLKGDRAVTFLAILSYPFYLIHFPVYSLTSIVMKHIAVVRNWEAVASDMNVALVAALGSFIAAYILLNVQEWLERHFFKKN